MNHLFHATRLRLAGWYAGVMGCILGLCGLGVYQVVAHAYRETIDQGIESAANALRTSIEPVLLQPGQPRQLAEQLSLERCQSPTKCFTPAEPQPLAVTAAVPEVRYYLRLVDLQHSPIALAGTSLEQLPLTPTPEKWQTLTDRSGERYRQIVLPLQVHQHQWGYLEVGRSLKDLDSHLAALRLTLLLGCPIALVVVGGSSWWLAGLAMQPIYRSYQQMQQFTADAAHELRTPLSAMQSTLDAALIQPQYKQDGVLPILRRQNLRLSQLVKDLLLLSRIDQQTQSTPKSLCCLNDIITDLVEEMASLAVAAQVKLIAQLHTTDPVKVPGYEDQIYRLVCNLIDNAIQATPKDGMVTVSLDRSESYAIVQIRDTGVGMTDRDQKRIFDRFYRIQADRSRNTGGSGLGLAIVQAIVQIHQGSIHVESQLHQGSTFTVRLPLA